MKCLHSTSQAIQCFVCFSCCTCICKRSPKHDVNMYLYLEFCCGISSLSKKGICYVQKEESTKLAINLLGFVEAALISNMTITYLLMSNESIYLCCTAYFSKFIYTSSIYYYDYHLFALYIYLFLVFH